MKRKRIAVVVLPLALALPAVAHADTATLVKARQKFFGIENVDETATSPRTR